MGDVIGDLNSRRGKPLGMEPKGSATEVKAEVPMAEVLDYAPDLRAITGGRGDFTMEFAHHEEVPAPPGPEGDRGGEVRARSAPRDWTRRFRVQSLALPSASRAWTADGRPQLPQVLALQLHLQPLLRRRPPNPSLALRRPTFLPRDLSGDADVHRGGLVAADHRADVGLWASASCRSLTVTLGALRAG